MVARQRVTRLIKVEFFIFGLVVISSVEHRRVGNDTNGGRKCGYPPIGKNRPWIAVRQLAKDGERWKEGLL